MKENHPYLEAIYDAVVCGDAPTVKAQTEQALADGGNPRALITEALIPAMQEVGERFASGEFFIPDMLIAARAMQGALNMLRPLLVQRKESISAGTVVLGTVQGDLHDLGKNLVGMMLGGAGFEVTDLGVNVPPGKIVEAVRAGQFQIVGLSALLTTSMPAMKKTIEALKEAGLRDRVKVIVGGAPITQGYADSIGADGYGKDASAAVVLAKGLLGIG